MNLVEADGQVPLLQTEVPISKVHLVYAMKDDFLNLANYCALEQAINTQNNGKFTLASLCKYIFY